MSEQPEKEKREKQGHVPFGQVILDDMFLLLLLGITVPFMIYLVWGYIDLASLPAMPEPEFSTAVSTTTPGTQPDALMLINSNGCLGCHSTDGSARIGPSWQGLYGSERSLISGDTVIADEEYLTRAIIDPNGEIAVGQTGGVMVSYERVLSESEVLAIVQYIKDL